jgi:hypothetical protein
MHVHAVLILQQGFADSALPNEMTEMHKYMNAGFVTIVEGT